VARRFKDDPRRWQRHARDLSPIRALFPTDQSDPGSASIVAPWLSDTVQIVYPYPPEYGTQPLASPAAGSNFTFQIPVNEHWQIFSISFRFLCSAVVFNRLVRIETLDGAGGRNFLTVAATVQTASQDRRYIVSGFGYDFGTADSAFRAIPLPPGFVVRAGNTIASLISSIQVADQLSEIRVYRGRVSS